MNLKFKNYFIEADGDRFNLYTLKEGKKGNYKSNIGYGYRFVEALKKIATLETAKKENITTIYHYIEEYHNIINTLLQKLDWLGKGPKPEVSFSSKPKEQQVKTLFPESTENIPGKPKIIKR